MTTHAGKTVREILLGKKGSIKSAALDPGSPGWHEILDLTWEELQDRAKRGLPGYQTIKKLLGTREYDK